jgi:hypothetical protein
MFGISIGLHLSLQLARPHSPDDDAPLAGRPQAPQRHPQGPSPLHTICQERTRRPAVVGDGAKPPSRYDCNMLPVARPAVPSRAGDEMFRRAKSAIAFEAHATRKCRFLFLAQWKFFSRRAAAHRLTARNSFTPIIRRAVLHGHFVLRDRAASCARQAFGNRRGLKDRLSRKIHAVI